ncbi:D-alanyl-D-alanine carboxypeptidase family protein [Cellulosilyticum ruminicola]|uniref:D-alanyl-D-alanine carboxypeptidase family protein n=1 Tax=Cellulosilyticum ruminicola TaxID=425254 RepID=UPI0006D14250|nr:D-alanyl-D-alanine carboxypeptidase family protein [Cellulosilyticum ruminicola]
MKRKVIACIMIACMFISQVLMGCELPDVKAKGALLMEADSGRILFEKNGYEALPMASTTKIMTCIVALENGNVDDIVTVSKRACAAPPVKLKLQIGEKQRLGDLLYSLMLESHNDTAVAIAEHIGGSVEHFCEMMTAKAREIGAETANFKTPNGLDAQGHGASAYDMALIARYAVQNPEFIKIVTTELISIPTKEVTGSRRHDLQCKNRFLYCYKGANGMKTGFTNKAGHCFVGSANRNNMQLVGVALAAGWGKAGKTRKYTDVINMMNYGFKNYEKVNILSLEGSYMNVPITKAIDKTIDLACDEGITLPLTHVEKENIVLKKVVPPSLKAPIKKGEIVGEVQILCGGTVLATAPLKAQESIKKANALDYIKNWIKNK